ncbi:GNAT family N-acetyltransferase [uncultured Devosia sp.]|nr:GNAT family N-acetyltransferase [uncultured Devosia sp.]MBN9363578.1 GNAT family N-acetyltransferase [Devosia sp.]
MNRAYRGAGASAGWTREDYIAGDRITENLLRADLLAKPRGSFMKWVVEPDGQVAGCVWLEPEKNRSWYLGSLATDPDRQNTGLGRTLLAAAERWIVSQGGTRVRLTVVDARETLIAWYVRRGYHLTGESEPFPDGDERFGRLLRHDLRFLFLEKNLAPGYDAP